LRHAAPIEKAERLVRALRDPFELTRAYAARSLAEVAPYAQGAVPDLVAALDDESAEVRAGAVQALCEIRDPEALTPLLDAAFRRRLLFGTVDLNSQLRWDVLRGIKSFGYAAQLDVLNGPNPVHRALILRGALHGYEPLPAEILLRACGSTYRDERQAAFQVLEKGEHRDAEVLAAMLADLKGPDPERAALAARVLGAMGETAEPAVPALIACVVGPEARLKGPASEALIRLGASARKPVEAARLNAPPEARPLFESILRGMEPSGKRNGGLPAEALPQQAEAIPGFDLEIRLLYDGRPLDWCALDVKPVVRVYLFETRNWVNAEPDGEGRLIAKDAQPGRCSVSVRIDAIPDQPKEDSGPGDYVGDANAVLERGENAPVEVPMRRILHLTSPADSREVLKNGSTHAGPVRFAWEPLGEGVRYDVTIRGTMPSSWTQTATTQPFIDLDLGPGDFCIEVYARRGKELLGTLNILRSVEYEVLGKKRSRVVSHRWYQYRAMPLESGPITVTGQLTYGGKPFDARGRGVTPVLVVQDLLNNKPYEGKVELDGDVYRLPEIPSGVYEIRAAVDAEASNPPGFPGDYFGKVSFGAREGRTPNATVSLVKVMRLLKPEDSARGVVFYPGAKLPPRVPTPVTFAWESLGEGVTYSYYVNPSGKRGQTKDCSVTLDLPADGTTYNFTLYGYASTGRLGELTFDGEHYRTSYPLQTGD
ncbi:MAG: HEAT repeat domain-containing protein, partial [Planctomycetota bacterium]|nr:HEAT repeat domain-containing protein [Planctomycetota bacterium]